MLGSQKMRTLLIGSLVVLAGCAGQSTGGGTSTSTSASTATVVKGPDGKEIGQYVKGKPAAGTQFAKLRFGMSPQEVMNTIGAPANTTSHETGKRWIPFYFGPDARRTEVLYKGEGCLTFTGGNIYGGGSNELISIEVDSKGTCFDS